MYILNLIIIFAQVTREVTQKKRDLMNNMWSNDLWEPNYKGHKSSLLDTENTTEYFSPVCHPETLVWRSEAVMEMCCDQLALKNTDTHTPKLPF